MQKKIMDTIYRDFPEEKRGAVLECISTVNLTHVMAGSDHNLQNTLFSILYLARGDFGAVVKLTEVAKQDFRDVIYWATLEQAKRGKKCG